VSGHLGDRLSAFVDGELDHDARDRALAHLAHCEPCRAEVEAERQVKSRLSRLDGPIPPSPFVARLAAVPAVEAAAVPQSASQQASAGAKLAGPNRPRSRRDRNAPRARRPVDRGRRRRILAGTSGAFVVAALGAAFAVGGGPAGGPPVTPQIDQFTVEHAAVADEVPLTDTGSAVTVSFLTPAAP
jgi:anti-sigma factor RsiW